MQTANAEIQTQIAAIEQTFGGSADENHEW